MATTVTLQKGKKAEVELLATGVDFVCSYKIELSRPINPAWELVGEGVNSDPGSPGNDRHELPTPTGKLKLCLLRWILAMDPFELTGDPRYSAVLSIRQDGLVVPNGLFTYVDSLPKKDGNATSEIIRQTIVIDVA